MLLMPAHAKVNLCLALRGRRPDGFHDIDSVVATIDWHDLVGVRLHRAGQTVVRLRTAGDARDLPAADSNLAARAARAVAAVAGPLEVELWLDKRVPSAAGLGGGSADAAAVLRCCAALLAAPGSAPALSEPALLAMGAELGSDVPVLVSGGMRRAQGRGETLTGVADAGLHLAVAIAGAGSTAAAYAAVESSDFEDASRVDAVTAAFNNGEIPDDELLGSGLEVAACRVNPELGGRLSALRSAVAGVRWHLTGSGGAAFALARSAAHGAELADAARAAGFPARACRTVSG